ncbi:MAG: HD domain-containing protein [Bacteroidaceae bacterium]|nr:HD domain-containing protein [Bacteroidaceae bacterium]
MGADVNSDLKRYIESEILPLYNNFDKAHQRPHADLVIRQSVELAKRLGVDVDMAYTIAAYHDTGLCEGRDLHHAVSARIIRNDKNLRQWFTEEQIDTMADAAEDHRASASHPPRTIYGRIVAEADRYIEAEDIIRRTIQFGLDHYPTLTREEHYQRMVEHLREKYGRGGYLRLWFPESPNSERLERLRQIIDDESRLQQYFDKLFISV